RTARAHRRGLSPAGAPRRAEVTSAFRAIRVLRDAMTKTRLASLVIATLGALGLLASFHTTAGTATRTAGSATKGTTPPATTAPPPQGTTPSTAAPPPPTTNTG